jgi:hypothetical protein
MLWSMSRASIEELLARSKGKKRALQEFACVKERTMRNSSSKSQNVLSQS